MALASLATTRRRYYEKASPPARKPLEAEGRRIARFLNRELRVSVRSA